MNRKNGFTLIELMITVAIIGILAAIALPAYQDYTIRAQVTEALVLTQEARSNVIEYHSNTGSLPISNEMAKFSGGQGNYVSMVKIENNGQIVATFSNNLPQAANLKINGKKLILSPIPDASTGTLIWTCSSDVEDKFVPTSCH